MKRGAKKKIFEVIVERYNQGKPTYVSELAGLTGFSQYTVTKVVRKLIAEKKVNYVYMKNRKYLIPNTQTCVEKQWAEHVWSDEEDIALIELNDLTCSELSKILKRSVHGIQNRREALNLKKKTKDIPKHLYKIFLQAGLVRI